MLAKLVKDIEEALDNLEKLLRAEKIKALRKKANDMEGIGSDIDKLIKEL